MSKRIAAAVLFLASLVASQANAEEPKSVRIPDQTVSIGFAPGPNLFGTIRDGEYAGVQFMAVPDASIPLPQEYRPEGLLAKLGPSAQVESVGTPPYDGPKDASAIRSALPATAFRLKQLVSADGQASVIFEKTVVPVHVVGYKTNGSRVASYDDLINNRLPDSRYVYISGYSVRIGDLPPCRNHPLCNPQR